MVYVMVAKAANLNPGARLNTRFFSCWKHFALVSVEPLCKSLHIPHTIIGIVDIRTRHDNCFY